MPILKQIRTDSAASTDRYLEREKADNDLPRVLYEWGHHCRPETARIEFRELRERHGRQGEMRRLPGRYKTPENPQDATHVKVGKNWREARDGETATHVRIAPEVPFAPRTEAFHDIVSFGLHEVDPRDPEQTEKAFSALVDWYEQEHAGEQFKMVAHGDARGSKVAQACGESGKFHVHVLRNAIVHSTMEVDGRVYQPGMRVGGPLTHMDTRREKLDEFINTRGARYGLPQQVLHPPRSKEAKAVRRTNQDFWARERGEISDHDRARRGMEAAYAACAEDPGFAGLDHNGRMEQLVEAARATGDVSIKTRTARGQTKIRSYVVPGRKQPLGATKLGGRYDNKGVAEQLDLIARGQWKPYERARAGPAKQIPRLSDEQVADLNAQIADVIGHEHAAEQVAATEPAEQAVQTREDEAPASTPVQTREAGNTTPTRTVSTPRRERTAASAPPSRPATYRSPLRDLPVKKDPRIQHQISTLAALDERWRGGLPTTAAERQEFEQDVRSIHYADADPRVNPGLLKVAEGHIDDEVLARLRQRQDKATEIRGARRRVVDLDAQLPKLQQKARADALDLRGDTTTFREARGDREFEYDFYQTSHRDLAAGDYTSRAQERADRMRRQVSAQVAALKPVTDAERRLAGSRDRVDADRRNRSPADHDRER